MRFPSRRVLAAVFALIAWANVQAMTCCAVTPRHAETVAPAKGPSAEEHSCCPGSATHDGPEQSVASRAAHAAHASGDGCGMGHGGSASLCCGAHEPALGSASADFVLFESRIPIAAATLVVLQADGSRRPEFSLPASTAGPPRYLSLRRFLI